MKTKLTFVIKEKMVVLTGTCFWFWGSLHSFLDSSKVPKSIRDRYPSSSYSKYDFMRNVLNDLENEAHSESINLLVSNFYRLSNAVDQDKLDCNKAKKLLKEFQDAVGNDPIETAIKERAQQITRNNYQSSIQKFTEKEDKLSLLNNQFLSLTSDSILTPQKRGFELEKIFFELMLHSEIEHTKPYRTPSNEQIDGHFRYEKLDYLVEIKWLSGQAKQPDFSAFDGKIRGKALSTRGLFLSTGGFDENAIKKYSGDTPRIILMNGEDLAIILTGKISISDVLKAKVDAIVRHGIIDFPVRKML